MEESHVNVTRRSRKVKNLEQEVEMILSQDESDEEPQPQQKAPSFKEASMLKTPSAKRPLKNAACTPQPSSEVLQDILQTPRRSCRKSVKPPQDYDDIIIRHSTRSAKKKFAATNENNEENQECSESVVKEEQHPKWSAADVGRSSSKRTRKSRRTTRGGKRNLNDSKYMEDETVHNSSDKTEEMTETVPSPTKKNNADFDNLVANEQTICDPKMPNQVTNDLKDNEEEMIQLLQDDTEDVNEMANDGPLTLENEPQKDFSVVLAKKEEISKNSIGNLTMPESETKTTTDNGKEDGSDMPLTISNELSSKTVNSPSTLTAKQAEVAEKNDLFGIYLKSQNIDMEDLGLNPIDDEEEADVNKKGIIRQDVDSEEPQEEMPSLIVCDDDDGGEQLSVDDKKPTLNATFDAEDSVVLVKENINTQQSSTSEATEMEDLQMSEDEENESNKGSAKKAPRIMLTTTEDKNQTLLCTPPRKLQRPYRVPTPYRTRSDNKPQPKETKVSAEKIPMGRENVSIINCNFTTMTPREIVLRGIRKRSMSVCLGTVPLNNEPLLTRSAKKLKRKAVNFYSPANQTAIIEDLDKLIEKSVKKFKKDKTTNLNKNITTRRKRSISCDDRMVLSQSMCVLSKLPRPVAHHVPLLTSNVTFTSTSSNISASTSKVTRTKLPNFAAIHQKQFQKMENLADHVARKQERSKILINSASKMRPASAQKNVAANINNKSNQMEKPKALKKIDMSSKSQIQNISSEKKLVTPRKLNPNLVKKPVADYNTSKMLNTSKLPDPRQGKIIIKPKQAMPPKNHLKPNQSHNVASTTLGNSAQKQKHKPAFNLSTHIGNNTTFNKSSSTSSLNNTAIENKSMSFQDKTASRLQRHMDLFKGRLPASRAGVASRKNEAAIKGVRSNRRFELQMQHRKNAEN
ncbi:uncharacterized protein LOC106089242 isoform X1 [Stomoxys calcitrans]|uniref:uncharacterized protein LOC106089242 isoform X1 n=2 Tax=Stomoxys calcitrans TaxID=35570 RepID=UPI0027E2AE07|nr:uncharacterized protein LOC106089242 isoform X1 [Stomoxys calcitrans]